MLRGHGAHGPRFLGALPPGGWARQFRLARWRRACGLPLHRGAHGPAGHGAARRDQGRHRRFSPQLRRHGRRAHRAAGARAAASGQRLRGHRGRHGDQHPAAQLVGDLPGRHRAHRRSQARVQRSAQVHQGPGFSHRRPLHQLEERAARHLRDRARPRPPARRMEERGEQEGCAAHRSDLDPVQRVQGRSGRAHRRGHHRQEAAHAGGRARRIHRRGPHRARSSSPARIPRWLWRISTSTRPSRFPSTST